MADHVDMLRRAAKLLRERTAAATPGPWVADGTEIYAEFRGGPWVGETCDIDDIERAEANGTWVATMHPGVGLALAALLDAMADGVQQAAELGAPHPAAGPMVGHALTMARLVLGEVPDA